MLKNVLRALFKEPFFYFILIGGCLYQYYAIQIAPSEALHDEAIVLPASLNPVNLPKQDRSKVQAIVDNEVMYREAWRLRLYEQDDVVRNRLIQKMRFATMEDIAAQRPSEAQIVALYQTRPPESMLPEAYSYEQRFFSNNAPLSAQAIERILDRLHRSEHVDGQAFHMGNEFKTQTTEKMGNAFGGEFLKEFNTLDLKNTSRWQGPITSVYGLHFIKMKSHAPAQQAPLDDVRHALSERLADENTAKAYDNKMRKMASRYRVTYE
jgi:peptidyl-prolyl cis-trans isomerase C